MSNMTETFADYSKLCVNINEELLIKIKELKKEYKMKSWNDLFLNILKTNDRPDFLVRNYQRHYEKSKKTVPFQPSLSPTAIIDFGVWCAPFSNQADALDYLVFAEISKNKFSWMDISS